jgi:hypothetical protein
MTILHSGASRKFADHWQDIFGKPGRAGKGSSARPTGKVSKKKTARAATKAKAAKKKPSAKKSGRK